MNLNNRINLDRAVAAADNASTGENPMSNSSKKTPWHLRFAPGAILRQSGLIAILALTVTGILLTTIPTGQVEAQSSGSSYTPQAGDEIAAIKIVGNWKRIPEWIMDIFGGAAGSALWDAVKSKWNAKPFTPSSGTVVAYAQVVLEDMHSETVWWYGKSGSPMSRHTNNLATIGRVLIDRDYQFMDYTTRWLYYDDENEIYVLSPQYFRTFGHDTYYPDIVNDAYNQGEPGAYYPDHEKYYKGKPGYLITWGMAGKHDVSHQFCSDVDEDSRDSALASAAVKEKLDKFEPKAYAYLSDMRYESSRNWTYTARTEPEEHKKKLSAIVDECKDVEFVPLNTRLDDFDYKNNKSTLFWKKGVTNAQPGDEVRLSSGKVIELQQAAPFSHDVADRRIETW